MSFAFGWITKAAIGVGLSIAAVYYFRQQLARAKQADTLESYQAGAVEASDTEAKLIDAAKKAETTSDDPAEWR